jgi:hypothetical protein
MIDNSPVSPKTNNYLSPSVTEHKNKEKTMTYDVGNSGHVLGQGREYGRVKHILYMIKKSRT